MSRPSTRNALQIVVFGVGLLIATLTVCAETPAKPPASAAPDDDGSWSMPAKNYASTRYSSLADITVANVQNLRVAFTFSTGVVRGHEAAPLVVNQTMYVVTPYPNTLFALDLSKPDAPLKWRYEPKPLAASQGVACCDVVNRGAVYSSGRIYFATLDGQAVAVDEKSGKEVWRTQLGNINLGETITMAPLVVKGKVLVGNSGGELGVRGWLVALDATAARSFGKPIAQVRIAMFSSERISSRTTHRSKARISA